MAEDYARPSLTDIVASSIMVLIYDSAVISVPVTIERAKCANSIGFISSSITTTIFLLPRTLSCLICFNSKGLTCGSKM